jgi:hypothetical protein
VLLIGHACGPCPLHTQCDLHSQPNPTATACTLPCRAFTLPAGQVTLRLQNVTLVVSQAEIRALQQALGGQYQWPGDAAGQQRLSAAQVAGLRPVVNLVEVGEITNTSIYMTNSAYDGIDGAQVRCHAMGSSSSAQHMAPVTFTRVHVVA